MSDGPAANRKNILNGPQELALKHYVNRIRLRPTRSLIPAYDGKRSRCDRELADER